MNVCHLLLKRMPFCPQQHSMPFVLAFPYCKPLLLSLSNLCYFSVMLFPNKFTAILPQSASIIIRFPNLHLLFFSHTLCFFPALQFEEWAQDPNCRALIDKLYSMTMFEKINPEKGYDHVFQNNR